MATTGCARTGTISPPESITDPQPIAVLDHGRHTSLVLPSGAGTEPPTLVEWAYGDWTWYALDDPGVFQGVNALLWKSSAGLGRGEHTGPLTDETVRAAFRGRFEALFVFPVSAAAVTALTDQLEALFAQGRAQAFVRNDRYRLAFVPHPVPYSLSHNSNHVAADWLRALGCAIDAVPLIADWRLRPDTTDP